MKLSIVIPTRERIQYLKESIRTALSIEDIDIEIIVSDNASDDETYEVLSKINDPRFKYVNTGHRVSMRANFENGLNNCSGDYIMFFGDDDGILPKQFPILKSLLLKHKPDVLRWPTIKYGWPEAGNTKTGGVRIKKSMVYGPIHHINSNQLLGELLNCDLKNEIYYPAIYHGIVSRKYINKLRTSDGQFFNCSIPDVFFSYQSLFLGGKLLYCAHPFTINGYSPASNGGAQKQLSQSHNIPAVAARFISENQDDKNLDVADFSVNVPSLFFLCLETARINRNFDNSPINYLAWFKYIIRSSNKMNPSLRAAFIKNLEIYAREINKFDIFEKSITSHDEDYNKFLKVKLKFTENFQKIGSVRLKCEKNRVNDIHTASQICDSILGGEYNLKEYETKYHQFFWNKLKSRYNNI